VDDAGVWPWLLRVTRNASIDVLRKRNAYRNVVQEDAEGNATDGMPSLAPSPHEAVEDSDFQVHLRRALATLAEPYRSIVVLREIQDFKYEEISSALELPLNTVKVYLHRGRRKLREALKEFVEREP
jgi:RNA polymerase sigma-70 factor (ECF subfamily)